MSTKDYPIRVVTKVPIRLGNGKKGIPFLILLGHLREVEDLLIKT